MLDIFSVGGTIANRFDSADVVYQRADWQPPARVPDAGGRLLRAGHLETPAEPDYRLRLALGRGGNPTPEANNEFMLDALRDVTFPNRGTTVDPTQIPDQWNQWGPRVGFRVGRGQRRPHGRPGLQRHRPRAEPALLFAAPMNNFRVPAGDLSPQLPFAVPSSNPTLTTPSTSSSPLIGIDLNSFRARDSADHDARTAARSLLGRSASTRTRSTRPQPLLDGRRLREPARHAVRRGHRAGAWSRVSALAPSTLT